MGNVPQKVLHGLDPFSPITDALKHKNKSLRDGIRQSHDHVAAQIKSLAITFQALSSNMTKALDFVGLTFRKYTYNNINDLQQIVREINDYVTDLNKFLSEHTKGAPDRVQKLASITDFEELINHANELIKVDDTIQTVVTGVVCAVIGAAVIYGLTAIAGPVGTVVGILADLVILPVIGDVIEIPIITSENKKLEGLLNNARNQEQIISNSCRDVEVTYNKAMTGLGKLV